MKRIIRLFLMGLLYSNVTYSQQEELDKLEKEYQLETVDSLKFKILDQLMIITDEHSMIDEFH